MMFLRLCPASLSGCRGRRTNFEQVSACLCRYVSTGKYYGCFEVNGHEVRRNPSTTRSQAAATIHRKEATARCIKAD